MPFFVCQPEYVNAGLCGYPFCAEECLELNIAQFCVPAWICGCRALWLSTLCERVFRTEHCTVLCSNLVIWVQGSVVIYFVLKSV